MGGILKVKILFHCGRLYCTISTVIGFGAKAGRADLSGINTNKHTETETDQGRKVKQTEPQVSKIKK
jgi:hypothetical protein